MLKFAENSTPVRELGLPLIFSEASLPGLRQEILAMSRGDTRCDVQVAGQTLSGRPLEFIVRWSVLTGYEDRFDRVYIVASDVTELNRIKKELETSEKKYRLLVENAGEAVMVLQNEIIRFANAAAAKLIGLSQDQLIGSSLAPLIHPEDRDWVLDRHRRRQAGENPPTRYSLRMICARNETRWVEISVVRMEWSDQPSVLMIASDITERKNEQEELRNTKNLLETIYNSLEEAVLLVDPTERRIVACNPAVESIFGYTPKELTGKRTRMLHIDQEHFERFARISEPVLDQKKTFHTKYRMRTRDGREIVTEHTITAIDELLGWDQGVISVIRDISERQKAEEDLRASEEKYRTLLEHASESVVLIKNDLVVYANPKAEELTGLSSAKLQGTPYQDFIHPDDLALLKPLMNQLKKGEQIPKDVEFRIFDKNGTLYWIRSNAVGLDWEGQPAVMAFMSDITRQKYLQQQNEEMEAQMLQAQKMESIGTLAGGIAHDFNNLLSVILGFTHLAKEEAPESETVQKNLSTVVEAGERAAELVNQILTFSRREKENKQPFQLQVIVKEALKMLRTSIPAHIAIHQDIQTDKYVFMDAGQVHQVIMNLCTNAYQSLPQSGGQITIELLDYSSSGQDPIPELSPGNFLRLKVTDNGQGIPEEIKDRIFEPYFTTKELGRGTGLGLSVVHGIVVDAGGTITVASKPEQGTRFDVFLPVWEGEVQREHVQEENPESLISHEHLLLVDDESAVLKLLRINLESLGYQVSAYSSPTQARDAFQQAPSRFDALITDLSMPELTGDELAEALNDIRPELPVIVCTGLQYEQASPISDAGRKRLHISKPVDKDTLARALRQVLDR